MDETKRADWLSNIWDALGKLRWKQKKLEERIARLEGKKKPKKS